VRRQVNRSHSAFAQFALNSVFVIKRLTVKIGKIHNHFSPGIALVCHLILQTSPVFYSQNRVLRLFCPKCFSFDNNYSKREVIEITKKFFVSFVSLISLSI
jgi:hypothetical protein